MCCWYRGRDRVYTQTWVEFVLHDRWPGPVAESVRQIVAAQPRVDLAQLTRTINDWVHAHGPDLGEPDYWDGYKPWAIARLADLGREAVSLESYGKLAQPREAPAPVLDR